METASKILNFSDVVTDLTDYYNNTVVLKNDKAYNYEGADVTNLQLLATAQTIKSQLSKDNIDCSYDKNGRDVVEELLGAAVRIGIQQGIYICDEKPSVYLKKKNIFKRIFNL